jgi:hypothetical protein
VGIVLEGGGFRVASTGRKSFSAWAVKLKETSEAHFVSIKSS